MTLALVAGEGALPPLLLQRLHARGEPVELAALEGVRLPPGWNARRFRVETLGSFRDELAARGVGRICFAGAITRPAVDPGAIDAATLPLVPRMMAAMRQGDDGVLRALLGVFEEAGIAPVAAHEIAPDLLPPQGLLAGDLPEGAEADAARAADVLAAMGPADVGQGCIVARGRVLAVEAVLGTEWMLATVAAARAAAGPSPGPLPQDDDFLGWAADWLSGPGMRAPGNSGLARPTPPGGLLTKAPKPGQDRRVDLPAIGPETVAQAAAAGLQGIAVAAGGVIVLDADEVRRRAEAAGLFVWVRGVEA